MTSGRKFENLSRRLFGGEWYLLITSGLTNQSERKALFICVVYKVFASIVSNVYEGGRGGGGGG